MDRKTFLVVAGLVAGVCCVMLVSVVVVVVLRDGTEHPEPPIEPQHPAQWTWSGPVHTTNVELELVDVRTVDEEVRLSFRVTNTSEKILVRYDGWYFSTLTKLSDEFGNEYDFLDFNPMFEEPKPTVRPGESVTDTFRFSAPVDAANTLTLTLLGREHDDRLLKFAIHRVTP